VDADPVATDQTTPDGSSLLYLYADSNRPLFASIANYERVQATDAQREQGTGHSVLVVEDDPDIAMGLQDLLEFEGFHVDCAPTCHHAFSSIEQHAYDAVLLDLGLPDGDGRSVLDKLQVSHPSLPVIILTASNRDLGPVRAYARLTKPWERKELCTLLRRATAQTPSSDKSLS
jgi:CheY-like chemotaxis protein